MSNCSASSRGLTRTMMMFIAVCEQATAYHPRSGGESPARARVRSARTCNSVASTLRRDRQAARSRTPPSPAARPLRVLRSQASPQWPTRPRGRWAPPPVTVSSPRSLSRRRRKRGSARWPWRIWTWSPLPGMRGLFGRISFVVSVLWSRGGLGRRWCAPSGTVGLFFVLGVWLLAATPRSVRFPIRSVPRPVLRALSRG